MFDWMLEYWCVPFTLTIVVALAVYIGIWVDDFVNGDDDWPST